MLQTANNQTPIFILKQSEFECKVINIAGSQSWFPAVQGHKEPGLRIENLGDLGNKEVKNHHYDGVARLGNTTNSRCMDTVRYSTPEQNIGVLGTLRPLH